MSKKYLSAHIPRAEYACRCCGKLPPDFYKNGEVSIEYKMLFMYFEMIREGYGQAIPITSGYRCPDRQIELYASGKSSTPYSTHIFGLALDLVVPPGDISRLVRIARENVKDLRIGWKAYRKNQAPHVHLDIGYLITPRWSPALKEGAEW